MHQTLIELEDLTKKLSEKMLLPDAVFVFDEKLDEELMLSLQKALQGVFYHLKKNEEALINQLKKENAELKAEIDRLHLRLSETGP